MDYQLEELGPERFQQFCQALLAKEYPNVQCLPIAQPDGGRDALIYTLEEKKNNDFIVCQMKFVRKPQAEKDIHKWLTDIMIEEAPKIKKLLPKGAKGYLLMTNVPGTAHLESGSIDKIHTKFSELLDIPFQCWWRDDLNRRLDNAWNLKWAYPELMTGPDILRYVFETGQLDRKEHCLIAIRAFLREQYENDQEVRFKQIELQNKLLDLFVDVPISFSHNKEERKYNRILRQVTLEQAYIMHISETHQIENESNDSKIIRTVEDSDYIGAANLLLHPTVQQNFPQIVIEGAPGQGKSTITQYVCQVHRMKLLNEEKYLDKLPENHKATSTRIPFRVDLRDLSTWLNKQNPFSSEENEELPKNWKKSLESFLAYQVEFLSGGIDFSVGDLHAVAKLSAFLIVLDGLDEVAEISKRQEIIREVKVGVSRLKESCASLQVVITSRPTAFTNSPGFPENTYQHLELRSMTRPLINTYSTKWIKARKLNDRDSSDVKKILKEKLDQPHIRELARNPMQLAILLSLIHARGSSLPDKRTALYDSYVDLFFNRESDKSPIVRKYRDLLIDIHRYLAWILHSEAEQGRERGSISSERLQKLLSEYLISEGHDPSIAENLFTGMVERVVALVSRVQGTYEFEVQPLREYFAARFLYETAPYSPPGSEQKGTKPDRFDAIARNFYWLNVTRFYAGCFSKGEIPSLVESLEDLVKDDSYHHINHPRLLAAMLLSDWVFTQNQKSMRKVIELLLDGLGTRSMMIFKRVNSGPEDILTLPKECGCNELVKYCFLLLRNKPAVDYARELIELIKANTEKDETFRLWIAETLFLSVTERTRYLKYGLWLEVLQMTSQEILEELISDDPYNQERLIMILKTKHWSFCQDSENRCNVLIQSVLNKEFTTIPNRTNESIIAQFAQFTNSFIYSFIFRESEQSQFFMIFRMLYYPKTWEDSLAQNKITSIALSKCVKFIDIIKDLQSSLVKEWKTDLKHWNSIVESIRDLWGDQWLAYHLANIASNVTSPKENYQDYTSLLDHSKLLCARALYAKSKGKSSEWWKSQFLLINTSLERMFVSTMFLTWTQANVFLSLINTIDDIICGFSPTQWEAVIHSMNEATQIRNKYLTIDLEILPTNLSKRTYTVIGMRSKPELAEKIYLRYLIDYRELDSVILEFCQETIINLTEKDVSYWNIALEIIRRNYLNNFIFTMPISNKINRGESINTLPYDIAKKITNDADKYPRNLVILAEAKCRETVASEIIPVGQIAQRDEWLE